MHALKYDDAWDFEQVYGAVHDFATNFQFDPDQEDYLVHITTGSHVMQICMFLLTESRHLPGKLLQTSPSGPRQSSASGSIRVIDLDLSRYDALASRFAKEIADQASLLKSGIDTKNEQFNKTIALVETVSLRSDAPILLMGPTGAGKTLLARRVYELKHRRDRVSGNFVEVNCATLRGDQAMSTLFGHRKGAFTGATSDRPGLLLEADHGLLFLDEIGELGLDEQAMLLRALEDQRFLPLGSDQEVSSSFSLIAGTNRDLHQEVDRGRFREDLLARIDLWTFQLPRLSDRKEDIEPNLDYELERYASRAGKRVTMNSEAREDFLTFANAPSSTWNANFRDLSAAVTRMATLSDSGRINREDVAAETQRLERSWQRHQESEQEFDIDLLNQYLSSEQLAEIDVFDQVQLAFTLKVCQRSRSMADAGRTLFEASRKKRSSKNDSDRLRKYLSKFGIEWEAVNR